MVRALFLAILLVVAGAGCTSRSPEQSTGGTTTTTLPRGNVTLNGFQIEGLQILPTDGRARDLREDDEANVTFTIRNDRDEVVSRFVTLLVDGEVRETENIRLEPRSSRDFQRTFGPLRGEEKLDIEVRAGDQSARASAAVSPWPRTGDLVDLGPATVRVERWLQDSTTQEILVNVTVNRKALPEGDYQLLRAHGLCADASGKVTVQGEARPSVPEPGLTSMTDIRLPPCGDIIYGIDITGQDAAKQPIFTRILFVDPGWTPPQP